MQPPLGVPPRPTPARCGAADKRPTAGASEHALLRSDWMTPMGQRIPGFSGSRRSGGRPASALKSIGFNVDSPNPTEVLSGCRERHRQRTQLQASKDSKLESLSAKHAELSERAASLRAPSTVVTDGIDVSDATLQMVPAFSDLRKLRDEARDSASQLATVCEDTKHAAAARRRIAEDLAGQKRELQHITSSTDASRGDIARFLAELRLEPECVDAVEARKELERRCATLTAQIGNLEAEMGENLGGAADAAELGLVETEEASGRADAESECWAALAALADLTVAPASMSAADASPERKRAEEATRLNEDLDTVRAETHAWHERHTPAQAELVRLHRQVLPPSTSVDGTALGECSEEEHSALEEQANSLRARVQEMSAELEVRPRREVTGLIPLEKQVMALADAVASTRAQLTDLSGDLSETTRAYQLSLEEALAHHDRLSTEADELTAELQEREERLELIRSERHAHEDRQRALQAEIEQLEEEEAMVEEEAEGASAAAAAGSQNGDAVTPSATTPGSAMPSSSRRSREAALAAEIERLEAESADLQARLEAAPLPQPKHATVAVRDAPDVPQASSGAGAWGMLSWLGLG